MKRNKILIIAIAICVVLGILASVVTGVLVKKKTSDKYDAELVAKEQEIATLNAEITSHQRNVYVATSDIKCGEQVTLDKLQSQVVPSSVPQDYFITEDAVGKVAKLNIPANIPILNCMLTDEVKTGVSEVEVSYLNLNTNLKENDYVDIRIKFPNGEDYIVCAKKNLKYLNLAAANVFLWLPEEELLLLSSAAVDAHMNGGRLYTTKYIEPSTQKANVVTYQPSLSVIREMASDPNIVDKAKLSLSVEARLLLEERLKAFQNDSEENGQAGQDISYTNTVPGASDGIDTSSTDVSGASDPADTSTDASSTDTSSTE